jgi:uncharacterized protein YqgV (UPF0045/DUF77 family)
MNHKINLALQILPKSPSGQEYSIIDKAIEVIKKSGLKYQVCPFETVIEGPYEKVMQLVKDAQDICFENGATELIANIKLQRSNLKDVSIEDKMGKYR